MLHSQDAVELNKKIDNHINDCNEQFDEGRKQFIELKECSNATTEAVNKLAGDMEPIIELKEDLKGAASLGIKIQKVCVWIVKWPVIGTGIYVIYNWVIDLIPK